MGLVYIYKGIGNEFETIKGNGTLKSLLPSVDWEHSVTLVSGRKVDEYYDVKDGEIVFVRPIPGATAVIIITAVVAVAAGVAAGIALYKSKQAQEEAENALKSNKLDSVETLPFCRGASNQSAQGRALPYIVGEPYFTPYRSQPKIYRVTGSRGEEEVCCMSFEAGHRDLVFKEVYIGDHLVWSEKSATVPQEGRFPLSPGSIFYNEGSYLEFRQGTDFDTEILNRSVSTEYHKEPLEHAFGTKKEDLKPVVVELPENSMSVDVCVLFDGLRKKEGDSYLERTVTIRLWWSNLDDPDPDNEDDWTEFGQEEMFDQEGFRSGTFRYNSKKQMRFVARKEFSYEECYGRRITIKALRTTPKAESGSQENCYLYYTTSELYDPNKSTDGNLVGMLAVEPSIMEKATRMALVVKADERTEGLLDNVSFVASGVAPIWEDDSQGGHWSMGKVPTRNPASWLLEVLISDAHSHSKFYEEELDLASFGVWYRYCEERGYHVDGALTTDQTKKDLCDQILVAGDASLVRNTDGLFSVAIDKKETIPVALLNMQDVRSPSVAKNFCRRSDGRKVTFLNRESWKQETVYVMRDGTNQRHPEDIITEDAPQLITEYEHAVRYSRRKLAEEYLQPKTLTVEVGREGAYYPLYSVVMVQLPQIKAGTESSVIRELEVIDGRLTRIMLSESVPLVEGHRNGVVIFATGMDGTHILELEIIENVRSDILTFRYPLVVNDVVLPRFGDVVSVGVLEDDGSFKTVTRPYKIVKFSSTEHGYSLELKDYNEAIYEDGAIPEYKSIVSAHSNSVHGIDLSPKTSDLMDLSAELSGEINELSSGKGLKVPSAPCNVRALAVRDGIELSCEPGGKGFSDIPSHVEWAIKRIDGDWETFDTASNIGTWFFDRNLDGYPEASQLVDYAVRCRITNAGGKTGPWAESVHVSTDSYGTWELSCPKIETGVSDRTVTLMMSQPSRSDGRVLYGEIKYMIEVRRPVTDAPDCWWIPASAEDPYTDEDNYKDPAATTPMIRGAFYAQTMPLIGQQTNNLVDTVYQFRVCAINDAGQSDFTETTVTALCTNIRDIVHARQTDKEIYVPDLSAISANLGKITEGSMSGNSMNYWALSTDFGATPSETNSDYQGAFRVGGKDNYLIVIPVLDNHNRPIDYRLEYHGEGFVVTAEKSQFSNEVIVYSDSSPLDRARITARGVYFEHRTSSDSETWSDIVHQTVAGVESPSLQSRDSLVITNADMGQRRRNGSDIGLPIPEGGIVWHFDTDKLGHRGETDGIITDLDSSVPSRLVGIDDKGISGLDFTPAVQAVAPFATLAKSLYGQYSFRTEFEASNEWTVDFWLKYIWNESQTVFRIGNDSQSVVTRIVNAEPYYNEPLESEPQYNLEVSRTFPPVYNEIDLGGGYLEYTSSAGRRTVLLEDEDIKFVPGAWVHVCVICSGGKVHVIFDKKEIVFDQVAIWNTDIEVLMNPSLGSFFLDELLVSGHSALPPDRVIQNSIDRYPYGALDCEKKHFVLDIDSSEVWTNLFDTDIFRQKVLAVINEYHG